MLGAGSTAQVSDEIDNGLQVPTDTDFFRSAHSVLNKEKKLSTRDFDALLKWLQEMFPPASSSVGFSGLPGLEEVMTILDLRTQDRPKQGTQYRKHYEALLNLIVLTFWRCLTKKGREIPSKRHDALARYLKQATTSNVISFNYDYVMDNALINAGMFSPRNYGVNFDWQYERVFERIPTSSAVGFRNLRFFKLHGSITWWRCTECNALIYIARVNDFDSVLRSRLGLEKDRFQCQNCRTESFSPFLIPPLLSKNYSETEWKHIWKNTSNVLRQTDKLIVWGYSLPATDFYAEYLFRSAPTGRKKRIGDLIVVNPNQQIAEKFKSLFRPKRLAWHANIDKYFEAENII